DFIRVRAFLFTHVPRALTQHGHALAIGKRDGFHFILFFVILILIVIVFIDGLGGRPPSVAAATFGAAGRPSLQVLRFSKSRTIKNSWLKKCALFRSRVRVGRLNWLSEMFPSRSRDGCGSKWKRAVFVTAIRSSKKDCSPGFNTREFR